MKFDLDNFDSRKGAEEGFELQLTDPKTGMPAEEYITVLGADSDAFQTEYAAQMRRHAQRIQKSRKAILTFEEQRANGIALLAAATVSWRGPKLGKVPFSKDAAAELYAQYPEIHEQVDRAIGDRANFLPGDSKSSSSSPVISSN